MRSVSRVGSDEEDAAQILRGYKERIERLEEEKLGDDASVQLYRKAAETVLCADSISTSVGSAGGFTWNTSEWGLDEFGGTKSSEDYQTIALEETMGAKDSPSNTKK